MSSIPLPALGVRPPDQSNGPLQTAGQMMQLRSMLQGQQLQQQQLQGAQIENQMRAQQLKDSQLYGKALLNSDPNNPESMVQYFVKSGGSGQGAIQLQQMLLARRKQISDIAASDATTGAKNLETLKQTNDLVAGKLHSLQALPDDQLQQAFAAEAPVLGKMDPNGQQHLRQLSQVQDPNQLRQGLKVLEYSYLGDSALADRELKQSEVNKNQQQAAEAKTNVDFANQFGFPKGTSDSTQFLLNYLKTNNLPNTPANRLKAQQEYIKESKIMPGVLRAEAYSNSKYYQVADPDHPGQTIMVRGEQVQGMPGVSSASVATPKAEQKYMTSGKGGQQITAYNTALAHLDTLQRLAGDLNNTNVQIANRAKQAWAEQTGNPAPANFAAAVNAMSGEVAAALKASGATDQEIAHVGDTFSRAQSPAQLNGAINTYRELLKGKAKNLQNQYEQGMQGKPNFNQQPSGGKEVHYKIVNGQLVAQ